MLVIFHVVSSQQSCGPRSQTSYFLPFYVIYPNISCVITDCDKLEFSPLMRTIRAIVATHSTKGSRWHLSSLTIASNVSTPTVSPCAQLTLFTKALTFWRLVQLTVSTAGFVSLNVQPMPFFNKTLYPRHKSLLSNLTPSSLKSGQISPASNLRQRTPINGTASLTNCNFSKPNGQLAVCHGK